MRIRWPNSRRLDAIEADLAALKIGQKVIIANQEKIMSAISDAVAAMNTSVTDIGTALADQTSLIQQLQAAQQSGDTAGLADVTAKLVASNQALEAAHASLTQTAQAAAAAAPAA